MTDMTKVLENRAAVAPAPPPDLAGRIEAGYHRRRKGRAASAAFAAVLMLAGGVWAATRPVEHRAVLPAGPVTYAPFRVPGAIGSPPPVRALPGAIVVDDFPAESPSGEQVVPVTVLDTGHLLLADLGTFYRYDVRARTFTVLVPGTDTSAVNAQAARGFAVTPEWIVWQVNDRPGGFSIHRAPRSGGAPERIAVVDGPADTMEWFAAAGYVFWSHQSGPGVIRLALTDGTTEQLPGFGNLVVDGSPWARSRPTESGAPVTFRHLVTWELRTVAPPAQAHLECVPTFCLDPNERFLQRPDGSNRTALPLSMEPPVLLQVGEGGLVILDHGVVLDPETGELGTLRDQRSEDCGFSIDSVGALGIADNWNGPTCPVPARKVFLPNTQ